jgi:hypothetical protein
MPTTSAVSASSRVPVWAATPLPSAVTDSEGRGLVRSWKCPSLWGFLLLRNFKIPREEGIFRVFQAVFTPTL